MKDKKTRLVPGWCMILLGLLMGCTEPEPIRFLAVQTNVADPVVESLSPLSQTLALQAVEENRDLESGPVNFSQTGFGCNRDRNEGNKTLLELGLWLTVFGGCVILLAWRTARIQRISEST